MMCARESIDLYPKFVSIHTHIADTSTSICATMPHAFADYWLYGWLLNADPFQLYVIFFYAFPVVRVRPWPDKNPTENK